MTFGIDRLLAEPALRAPLNGARERTAPLEISLRWAAPEDARPQRGIHAGPTAMSVEQV